MNWFQLLYIICENFDYIVLFDTFYEYYSGLQDFAYICLS